MFDLEKAIGAWRRTFRYRRAFTPGDLKELECHLRDQIDGLRDGGLSDREAFHRAVGDIGDHGTTEREYRKVFWEKARHHRRLGRELTWRVTMGMNYLKVALRAMRRRIGYSVINVTGLAVAMACCLLILQYVSFERSYDRFHEHADDLYRLTNDRYQNGVLTQHGVITYPSVAKALARDYPEVLNYTRLVSAFRRYVQQGDLGFEESNLVYADSAFLIRGRAGQLAHAVRPPGLVYDARPGIRRQQ